MKEISLLVRSAAILSLLVLAIYSQGVTSPYASRLRRFTTGLDRPVLIRSANDGAKRLFVVEQGGMIKVFQPGANIATNFFDLSSEITTPANTGDERGLLGLTFHPQFRSNGKFYVSYTRLGDGAAVVAEYTTVTGTGGSNSGDISKERVLLTVPQPFANHNGGMLEFGPDGYLYIGMGDGGSANDPGDRARYPCCRRLRWRREGRCCCISARHRSLVCPTDC